MMYLLLLLGFVLLLKGADLFVDGSASIAALLKIPSLIIGLTIVAMGTSAPEAAVSITAGLAGNSDISLGNIVGSNIFNLLMVIGVSALIRPVETAPEIRRRDLWWNIFVSIALLVTLFDRKISFVEGLIFLALMAFYLFLLIRNAKRNTASAAVAAASAERPAVFPSILRVLTGLTAVILGGNLVVKNASLIAASLGMSDTLIGLTIVAIGTSLPELATSIVAAKKGDSGIALGNAVGSCLFNILFILGASAVLTPIHASTELFLDTAILIVVSIIILIFAGSRSKTSRTEGVFCILIYLCYMAYIIVR